MSRPDPLKWPPLVGTERLSLLIHLRDLLLTLGMWVVFGFLLRDAIALLWDYFTYPRFVLTFTEAPDWPVLWILMKPYAAFIAILLTWLLYWGFMRRHRLADSSFKPNQPEPLSPELHARSLDQPLALLQDFQSKRVMVVHFDHEGRIIRVDDHQPDLRRH